MLLRPFVKTFEVIIPRQAGERAVVEWTIRISLRKPPVVNDGVFGVSELVVGFCNEEGGAFGGVRTERSEERRVGKGGGARGGEGEGRGTSGGGVGTEARTER